MKNKKNKKEMEEYKRLSIKELNKLVDVENDMKVDDTIDPIILELRNDIKMITHIGDINHRTDTFLSIIADYTFILSILEEREEYELCKEIMDELTISPKCLIDVIKEVENNIEMYIRMALEEFKSVK